MKIYRNKYAASYEYYFVEMVGNERFSYGLHIENSSGRFKLRYGRFEKTDLRDTEHFPVVGKINLAECVMDSVKENKDKTEKNIVFSPEAMEVVFQALLHEKALLKSTVKPCDCEKEAADYLEDKLYQTDTLLKKIISWRNKKI